jgi:hypothetical protein
MFSKTPEINQHTPSDFGHDSWLSFIKKNCERVKVIEKGNQEVKCLIAKMRKKNEQICPNF